MKHAVEMLGPAVAAFLTASIGFWSYLRSRLKVDDESRAQMILLLMGLAQTNIIRIGMGYINRGYVTTEEFQDFQKYLYEPYNALGGNGTVERIMRAVERLPFHEMPRTKAEAYREIEIRQTDETGTPHDKPVPPEVLKEGDRRGRQDQ